IDRRSRTFTHTSNTSFPPPGSSVLREIDTRQAWGAAISREIAAFAFPDAGSGRGHGIRQ
ncbi:hypothetical protein, partial [Saccharopolyspora shandongensis]|uniref:hypothetical protein n=1 Tax=Saccharopolyspora shandongensis TaxID=418495 RepID=UPI0033E92D74